MNFLITEFSMIDVYLQKQPLELLYKKKLFLKISQNSQENNCVRVFF